MRSSCFSLLCACAGVWLASMPARAQNASPKTTTSATVPIATQPVAGVRGGDTIVLKDGTVLHGTIGEMTPGQAVTITLPSGERRTLAWAALDRVDIARAKAAAPAPETAVVHLEGARADLVLQSLDPRGGSDGTWQTVCRGACDRPLPTSGLYRVDAPGVRTSRPFRIEGPSGSYRVDTASSAGFAGGLTMVILGGAALLNGIGFLVISALYAADFGSSIDMGPYAIAGAVLSGVGAPLMIAGIVVMKSNGRTTVTPATATARVPAWREAPRPVLAVQRTAFGVPLIAGTF